MATSKIRKKYVKDLIEEHTKSATIALYRMLPKLPESQIRKLLLRIPTAFFMDELPSNLFMYYVYYNKDFTKSPDWYLAKVGASKLEIVVQKDDPSKIEICYAGPQPRNFYKRRNRRRCQ